MTTGVGRQVKGYISNISTKVGGDGVVYFLTISTASGEELVVRMRQPPEWVFVGTPVSGVVVRADDVYQIQDFTMARELNPARVVEVDSCMTTYVGSGGETRAIVTGRTSSSMVSAPALTVAIGRKAEKIGFQKTYIHLADLPIGTRVVAVQTSREYRRDVSTRKFISMAGADAEQ
ncbi:MAG: hypothetical protein RMI43_06780 [Candidatus Caldarchaeum sp.]|nr:hypothetical protein [Candidatus Caldarchaeum sp.]MCS7134005.1 hypothetical protein [Candidatus Caldarchaeum sp.]MDW8063858.1 hypothetical protein [Candidatus Caldarchaeum sp.]MDW8434840.1 hypothetical protein [Candidatus Caldarchaeum sp.]